MRNVSVIALRRERLHRLLDRRVLIPHRELDGDTQPLLQCLLHMAARDDERRPFVGPDLRVGVGGFAGARRQNSGVDYAESYRPRRVEHAAVHEELAQVAAHIRHGGRVWRPEVHEKNGASGHLLVTDPVRGASALGFSLLVCHAPAGAQARGAGPL